MTSKPESPPPAPTLRELAKAVNARTPGPWRTASNRPFGPWVDADTVPLAADCQPVLQRNWKEVCLNAAYIAHAHPAAVLALYAERDEARRSVNEMTAELHAVSNAIGTNEYLDPPDGGSVTLGEQVGRMREERDQLRAALREAQQNVLSFASIPRPFP